MNFLNPSILFALSLTIIPLIIHLINLKKHRTMYFSSLFFLKNTIQQTKKTRKIYEWLILLMRTMVIAAVVFAFAQPVLNNQKKIRSSNYQIIIDNTLSMQGENSTGNIFEQARLKAKELINKLDNAATFNIHTLANGIIGTDLSKDKALQAIGEITLQHGLTTINEILKKHKSTDYKTQQFFIISDFQRNIIRPDTILKDSLLQINAIKTLSSTNNVSIDSVWFSSPAQWINTPIKVFATIQNHSDGHVKELPVRTMVNDQLYAAGTINIDPNQKAIFETSIDIQHTGIQSIYIEIDDIPISFDNRYYSGIYISPHISVLEIGETPSPYIKALLNDTSYIYHSFANSKNITPGSINNADAIIIQHTPYLSEGILETINEKIVSGTNLIIIPKIDEDLTSINELHTKLHLPKYTSIQNDTSKISQANINHPLYNSAIEAFNSEMNLPIVNKNYKIQNSDKWTPVLFNDLNIPMLMHQKTTNGNTYLFGFDALNKSFALNPLFIPTLYNSITITAETNLPHLICNHAKTISLRINQSEADNPPTIKGNDNEFIPYAYMQQNNYLITIKKNQIKKPGYYRIVHNGNIINSIAANHDPHESRKDFLSTEELQNQYFAENNISFYTTADSTNTIVSPVNHLWKYFIAMALIFIIIETLLLRKSKIRKAQAPQ